MRWFSNENQHFIFLYVTTDIMSYRVMEAVTWVYTTAESFTGLLNSLTADNSFILKSSLEDFFLHSLCPSLIPFWPINSFVCLSHLYFHVSSFLHSLSCIDSFIASSLSFKENITLDPFTYLFLFPHWLIHWLMFEYQVIHWFTCDLVFFFLPYRKK